MAEYALTELTRSYESALLALRTFKDACAQVTREAIEYETTDVLLHSIPLITKVYAEYHDKAIVLALSENEFY